MIWMLDMKGLFGDGNGAGASNVLPLVIALVDALQGLGRFSGAFG